jgi:hypothetical protein
MTTASFTASVAADAKCRDSVVFPLPPFWLKIEMVFMGGLPMGETHHDDMMTCHHDDRLILLSKACFLTHWINRRSLVAVASQL